jgi:hypothetical protein
VKFQAGGSLYVLKVVSGAGVYGLKVWSLGRLNFESEKAVSLKVRKQSEERRVKGEGRKAKGEM